MNPKLFWPLLGMSYRAALRTLGMTSTSSTRAAWASAHASRAARDRASQMYFLLPCDECEREVFRRYLVGDDFLCVYCKRKKEH